MFSGYLMAAVYHLDGVGGFKGWQWLFIVNTSTFTLIPSTLVVPACLKSLFNPHGPIPSQCL
jgi:hypothetical protein